MNASVIRRTQIQRPRFGFCDKEPFLAPEAVIFGVDFRGPYILVVTAKVAELLNNLEIYPQQPWKEHTVT
jgi:hypothetical protein